MTSSKQVEKNNLSKIRRWMQAFFVLLTFLIGLRHIMPGEASRGGSFDAFCPFGGIETLYAYITTGHTLKSTNLLNFSFLLGVVGLSLVSGRSFCGWVCPIGSLQDLLANWARRLSGSKGHRRGLKYTSRIPVQMPSGLDKRLRYAKYLILAIILIASTMTVFPPLHSICPALAIFSFHWDTPLLGLVLLVFILTSLVVKRFSCKYLCPLGAALAIFNKFSFIHIHIDQNNCTNCGRCDNECPVDIAAIPENARSSECIRCLECMETCAKPEAINLHLG